MCKIKCILDNCGLSYIWLEQDNINTKECKLVIHERIEDIALHSWFIDISSSSMCIFYRLYKKHLDFERYLTISHYSDRISLTKFRCANSKLPVYDQLYMYDTDKCTLCDLNARGDEYHYILICPFFKQNINRNINILEMFLL